MLKVVTSKGEHIIMKNLWHLQLVDLYVQLYN